MSDSGHFHELEAIRTQTFTPTLDTTNAGAEGPQIFGDRYRISQVLGEGAFGIVYRAVDTLLGRDVAIKLLKQPQLEQKAREQFLHEAKLVASLDISGVSSVYDVLHLSSGELCMIFPFFADGSLRQSMDKFCLRAKTPAAYFRLRSLMKSLSSSLCQLHAAKVIHRDIKPENIMMDNLQPHLIDFGIAIAGAPPATSAGTPAYMSPEQISDPTMTSHKSDIFSLGVLFYELMFGSRPFVGTTVPQLFKSIVEEEPIVPADIKDILTIYQGSQIRKEVHFCMTMLSKKPAFRPSAQEAEAFFMGKGGSATFAHRENAQVSTLSPGEEELQRRMPDYPRIVRAHKLFWDQIQCPLDDSPALADYFHPTNLSAIPFCKIIDEGFYKIKEFGIFQGTTRLTFGTDDSCDIRLDAMGRGVSKHQGDFLFHASRQHFALYQPPFANALFLNGKYFVGIRLLSPGDEIQVGPYRIIYLFNWSSLTHIRDLEDPVVSFPSTRFDILDALKPTTAAYTSAAPQPANAPPTIPPPLPAVDQAQSTKTMAEDPDRSFMNKITKWFRKGG